MFSPRSCATVFLTGFRDRYDWTHDGNEWKKYRAPRVPFFMLVLIGLEAKGLLAFQGRRGIASVVRWNLHPVICSVEGCNLRLHRLVTLRPMKCAPHGAIAAAVVQCQAMWGRHCHPSPIWEVIYFPSRNSINREVSLIDLFLPLFSHRF